MDRKHHWENVYQQKNARETSWHQDIPQPSLSLILEAVPDRETPVIDIGGGASALTACLAERCYSDLTVLDVSAAALTQAKRLLGEAASAIIWLATDVTHFSPTRQYGLWHDRAAFHFLTDQQEQQRYVEVLKKALLPGGQVVIAAFSPRGPTKCSGLEIVQYDTARLAETLGPVFRIEETREVLHVTPLGREQSFNYFRLIKIG